MITRFDGGYLVTKDKETIIITDEELRVAKMAERDLIRPMWHYDRRRYATT